MITIFTMRIHRHRHRQAKFDVPDFKVNDEITAPQVRLISDDGENEVLSIAAALARAEEMGLDLIEVSPKAEPPVVKIMDHGSFKYQKVKEAKKQRAAQKEVEIKGVRLTLRIGPGDLDVRLRQALGFLEDGNKIRIEIILRGREKAYRDRAITIINGFIDRVRETYQVRVESDLKDGGNKIQTVVSRVS